MHKLGRLLAASAAAAALWTGCDTPPPQPRVTDREVSAPAATRPDPLVAPAIGGSGASEDAVERCKEDQRHGGGVEAQSEHCEPGEATK